MTLPPPVPDRCYIQVHGSPADLEYLELLVPVYGGEMATEATNTLVYAPSFEDGGDLQAKGRAFLDYINQAAIITLDRFLAIEVGASWVFDSDGERTARVNVMASLRISSSVSVKATHSDGTVVARYPEDQLLANARSAASRPHLAAALRLYAKQGSTWGGLYKVTEALQDVMGGLPKAGLCTKGELDRFTRTANNSQALGDDARHVKPAWPKPANPMTLEEARQFVRRILQQALTP